MRLRSSFGLGREVGTRSPVPVALAGTIVILLTVGGVGYACTTGWPGSAGGMYSGYSDQIIWSDSLVASATASYVRCILHSTTTELWLTVSDLAPGSGCALNATVRNVGEVAVGLDASIALHESKSCPYFLYTDNVHGLTKDPVVHPSAAFAYHGTFLLKGTATEACQGQSASLEVVVTAGPSCAKAGEDTDCG